MMDRTWHRQPPRLTTRQAADLQQRFTDHLDIVVWTSLGPLPRWVLGPTTRWAPGTTRLALHGT
jgi:hypothetical protein